MIIIIIGTNITTNMDTYTDHGAVLGKEHYTTIVCIQTCICIYYIYVYICICICIYIYIYIHVH